MLACQAQYDKLQQDLNATALKEQLRNDLPERDEDLDDSLDNARDAQRQLSDPDLRPSADMVRSLRDLNTTLQSLPAQLDDSIVLLRRWDSGVCVVTKCTADSDCDSAGAGSCETRAGVCQSGDRMVGSCLNETDCGCSAGEDCCELSHRATYPGYCTGHMPLVECTADSDCGATTCSFPSDKLDDIASDLRDVHGEASGALNSSAVQDAIPDLDEKLMDVSDKLPSLTSGLDDLDATIAAAPNFTTYLGLVRDAKRELPTAEEAGAAALADELDAVNETVQGARAQLSQLTDFIDMCVCVGAGRRRQLVCGRAPELAHAGPWRGAAGHGRRHRPCPVTDFGA